MYGKEFPINWGRNTHSKCGHRQFMDWSLWLSKKRKARQAPAFTVLCFLTGDDAMWLVAMTSQQWWINARTLSQNKPAIPEVVVVMVVVRATRPITEMDQIPERFSISTIILLLVVLLFKLFISVWFYFGRSCVPRNLFVYFRFFPGFIGM